MAGISESTYGPNNSAVVVHPIWGRWLPDFRLNTDQVGINFDQGKEVTIDRIGSKRVWLPGSKNAGEYRFATAQMTVRAANGQQPRLQLVFAGTGKRISKEEQDKWDPRVRVTFQKKAWMDDTMCREWAVIEAPNILRVRVLLCVVGLCVSLSVICVSVCVSHRNSTAIVGTMAPAMCFGRLMGYQARKRQNSLRK